MRLQRTSCFHFMVLKPGESVNFQSVLIADPNEGESRMKGSSGKKISLRH